jgi:putative transposase
MDFEVTALEKALNRQRVKFRDSSRWCRLTKRIGDRTKNEVNRILNLVARDAKELVVESLDFRSPRLGRATKRIVARAGRKAVETKLVDLEDRHGVTVTRVNPAYTSRECSSCGFVHVDNRKGKHFACKHCGFKLHADTNAARVIKGRSLEALVLSGVRKEEVLVLLDRRFERRHGYSMAKVP